MNAEEAMMKSTAARVAQNARSRETVERRRGHLTEHPSYQKGCDDVEEGLARILEGVEWASGEGLNEYEYSTRIDVINPTIKDHAYVFGLVQAVAEKLRALDYLVVVDALPNSTPCYGVDNGVSFGLSVSW